MREIEPHTAPPLIDFPCTFPIKVMGETHEQFSATMVTIIQTVVPTFTAEHVMTRASSAGKYISLTCSVEVASQDQLDDIYRLLSAHPLVKFAL